MTHRITVTEYDADKLEGFNVIPSVVLGLPKVKIHTLQQAETRQEQLLEYTSGLKKLDKLLAGGAFMNGLIWNFAAAGRIDEKSARIGTNYNSAVTQLQELETLRFEDGKLAYKLCD